MKVHYDDILNNRKIKKELTNYLYTLITRELSNKKYNSITIACIGTDRYIMDSIGPFVGEFLKNKKLKNVNVIGNLENPLHAKNVKERIQLIPEDSLVIAVDACITSVVDTINHIFISNTPIRPGSGAGKKLGKVGKISIKAIVGTEDQIGTDEIHMYDVMNMVNVITNIILKVLPNIKINIEAA